MKIRRVCHKNTMHKVLSFISLWNSANFDRWTISMGQVVPEIPPPPIHHLDFSLDLHWSQWPPRSASQGAEFRPWAENLDPCKILSNQRLNLQNAQLNLIFWPLCYGSVSLWLPKLIRFLKIPKGGTNSMVKLAQTINSYWKHIFSHPNLLLNFLQFTLRLMQHLFCLLLTYLMLLLQYTVTVTLVWLGTSGWFLFKVAEKARSC